jgi:hypothetical protein
VNASATLDELGFLPTIAMCTANWAAMPDTPGVYVIFDRAEVIYVGMAGRNGKGSLHKRLRDHSTGQVVNMFAQYTLFNRLLDSANLPRSPQEAGQRCRAYIRKHCMARVNERSKLTRVQRLILTQPMRCKAPRRAALI